MSRVLAVGVVSLALAGGMTAGSAGADQATLSKSEYIDAADDICRQSDELREDLAAQHFGAIPEGQEPTPEQVEAFFTDALPIFDQQLGSLRALPKPEGDAKKLKKLYKALSKAIAQVEDEPVILLTDQDPFAKADKLAVKYGFKVCGAS